ncbi:MAG: DUF4124 domain-containing protein [Gammaproteobacteria bacterium]|nr:MAG: DUF4124 domain-containing protein [Gammaproteobacteria bacterium]
MKTIASVIFLFLPLCSFSAVYKWTDKNGKIHYSDTPRDTQSKEIELPEASSYTPPPSYNTGINEEKTKEEQKKEVKYQEIKISSPENDQAVHSAPGSVTINVSVTPALQSSHKVVIYIDGKKLSEGGSASATIQNVDRGTHTVKAEIVDESGKKLISSKSSTFHLIRPVVRN